MIWELILEALNTLRTNLLRTILTMTGIILGVAAVIAIMNLGQSAYTTAEKAITGSGHGNIQIYTNGGIDSRLPLNDNVINVLRAADVTGVTDYVPKFYGGGGVAYNSDDDDIDVSYGYRDLIDLADLKIVAGHLFTQEDIDEKSQVVVVDEYTAKKLFGSNTAALQQTLRLNDGSFYRIVGVSKQEGMFEATMGRLYFPKSLGELEPFFQTYGYSYLSVNIEIGADYEQATKEIQNALMEAYGFEEKDEGFIVENVKGEIAEIGTFMTAFSVGLSLIAAISLLVGGVGIMNIMLVNVSERTKEIGLMKALGAQEKDITFQFLVEAVVMTVCGGLLGAAIGIGGSYFVIWVVNTFIAPSGTVPEFQFVISQASILVSLGVSIAIGLGFGAYPAKRAAKLDPVEALRHD